MIIDVVIPAYNEEDAITQVIEEIPRDLVQDIIVANNGSTDHTAANARSVGAIVVDETKKGYGAACLKGLEYISLKPKDKQPDIVVFLDGDHSDYPNQMKRLIDPIVQEGFDLVIGSRALGKRVKGSMTLPQIVGNWIATRMLKWFYGVKFTDLGPFRSMKYSSLLLLEMQDENFGWTVEMQLKAAKQGMKCLEVAVDYRKRIGVSKISGTIKGAISAGYIIIKNIIEIQIKWFLQYLFSTERLCYLFSFIA